MVRRVDTESPPIDLVLKGENALGLRLRMTGDGYPIFYREKEIGGQPVSEMSLEEVKEKVPWVVTREQLMKQAGAVKCFVVVVPVDMKAAVRVLLEGTAVVSTEIPALRIADEAGMECWLHGNGSANPASKAIAENKRGRGKIITGIVVYSTLSDAEVLQFSKEAEAAGLKFMVALRGHQEEAGKYIRMGIKYFWCDDPRETRSIIDQNA